MILRRSNLGWMPTTPSSRNRAAISGIQNKIRHGSQICCFVLACLLIATPLHADFETAFKAYGRGDYQTALEEWQKVADNPSLAENPYIYRETLYGLAMLYWQGKGVRQDFGQAHGWLLKAAQMDHPGAQAKLGFLYTDGNAVAQDYSEAFQWFTKAARNGNVDGQYNLGIFYYYGWGVEKDATMAAQYLAAASAKGDEAAEEALQMVLTEIATNELSTGDVRAVYDREEGETASSQDAETVRDSEMSALAAADHAQPPLLGENWIGQQNPDHYTIQVIALSNLARLENLIEGFEDYAPFALYTVKRQNADAYLYVLLQGNYPDVDSARKARDYFPKAIQITDQLWIRQFGMVQEQIASEP